MKGLYLRILEFCGYSRAMTWLLIINVAISAVLWILLALGWITGISVPAAEWLSLPSQPSLILYRPWSPLTYMVTHIAPLHLLFNMLWLYWFGRLADIDSDSRLLTLYIGGGIAGALCYLGGCALFYHGFAPSLIGASASVMAIMAAAAVEQPNLRISLFLLGSVKLKWIAIVTMILTLIGVGGGNSGGQFAHIGGAAFGLVAGLMMRRGRDISTYPATLFSRLSCLRSKASDLRRKIHYKTLPKKAARSKALFDAMEGRLSSRERLDQLLDKIRVSGYESLTRAEKAELNALSNKLND